ncbi:sensor histidine kinase [Bradyrhizobium sp. HKCCYLRH3059]|uniref:sensor histidine kinase n=1 Tax=Bradyrhizobium sp. HKCCYLRH3059 TaxID=3420745 RepID=UPI003EB81E89
MTTFSVDTHLFRELGELLVGRDSTALIELIKNAYDADATSVVVYAESLSHLGRGFITIRDNGIGMSEAEFERGFLTIASRTKDDRARRSKVFQRRYTGQKGVGRLAAHKLARRLEITSTRWSGENDRGRHPGHLPAEGETVDAVIDWDKVEASKTLAEVNDTDAISVRSIQTHQKSAGTSITLRNLRRNWTPTEHGRFLEELQAFQPPPSLTEPLPRNVSKQLLFASPQVRDIGQAAGNRFFVELEGELAPPDDYWTSIVEAANWIIEIDADRKSKQVRFSIAPTSLTLDDETIDAVSREFVMPHPFPTLGPFFQARILKRTGRGPSGSLKQWAGRSSGIRVFMEGFRVLPYGEPTDDWLQLDKEVAERGRWHLDSDADVAAQLSEAEKDPKAGLNHLPNKHYFGAVFLTERDSLGLQMLVNREGFIPNQAFATLTSIVRTGIDLSTRVQAAATERKRADRRVQRRTPDGSVSYLSPTQLTQQRMSEAKAHAAKARELVSAGKVESANKEILSALSGVEEIASSAEGASQELAMFRVLASVGTQVASFIHEINGLRDMATAVERALTSILDMPGLPREHRREIAALQRDVGDLKRSVERQAAYLIDVVTPDARRRRSRQSISNRFDTGARLVSGEAERRKIKILNKIPHDLKSPPMFAAELTTIFSNLLSNAVKAAGNGGTIRGTARQRSDGTLQVRVENTGQVVKARDRERFFLPFESTTTSVDAALGQGMGLGLTITRSMLEEYGATIQFVEPTSGFATALEIIFPE